MTLSGHSSDVQYICELQFEPQSTSYQEHDKSGELMLGDPLDVDNKPESKTPPGLQPAMYGSIPNGSTSNNEGNGRLL